MRFPFSGVMRQVVRMLTAKFTVSAPGMEQVQRPQIDGASSQVSAAGSLRDDGGSAGGVGGFSHAVVLPRAERWVAAARSSTKVLSRACADPYSTRALRRHIRLA